MKKALIIIVGLAAIAVAIAALAAGKGTTLEAPGTSETPIATNFSQSGHLVKDNPGMKPGVWFLIYEKPGAPALSAELVFDNKSVCKFNGAAGTCPDVLLPSSALTKVEGVLRGGVVNVVRAISGE